eukprot:SAG25_NODE_47_length_18954_cov_11.266295_3_plen_73_part_00
MMMIPASRRQHRSAAAQRSAAERYAMLAAAQPAAAASVFNLALLHANKSAQLIVAQLTGSTFKKTCLPRYSV